MSAGTVFPARVLCKWAVVLAAALWSASCEAQGPDGEPPPGEAFTIAGRLTDEGVECQALRGRDGTLYTLLGDLAGFENGDDVEIEATPVSVSFCMQGETVRAHAISAAP